MIYLTRQDLREIATMLIVANTPASFYEGLTSSNAMKRLSNIAYQTELSAHYDHVTSRARRSEFAIALAYLFLIRMLMNNSNNTDIDVTRLEWGQKIADIIRASSTSGIHTCNIPSSIIITSNIPAATNLNYKPIIISA